MSRGWPAFDDHIIWISAVPQKEVENLRRQLQAAVAGARAGADASAAVGAAAEARALAVAEEAHALRAALTMAETALGQKEARLFPFIFPFGQSPPRAHLLLWHSRWMK